MWTSYSILPQRWEWMPPSHSMEAYSSPIYHPMAHGIALSGMRSREHLVPAVEEERYYGTCASSSCKYDGCNCISKGSGAMHSLAHPCGAVLGTHHGLTNAVVMPYVLNFNRPKIESDCETLASQAREFYVWIGRLGTFSYIFFE